MTCRPVFFIGPPAVTLLTQPLRRTLVLFSIDQPKVIRRVSALRGCAVLINLPAAILSVLEKRCLCRIVLLQRAAPLYYTAEVCDATM
jgi:hypothetical protein